MFCSQQSMFFGRMVNIPIVSPFELGKPPNVPWPIFDPNSFPNSPDVPMFSFKKSQGSARQTAEKEWLWLGPFWSHLERFGPSMRQPEQTIERPWKVDATATWQVGWSASPTFLNHVKSDLCDCSRLLSYFLSFLAQSERSKGNGWMVFQMI